MRIETDRTDLTRRGTFGIPSASVRVIADELRERTRRDRGVVTDEPRRQFHNRRAAIVERRTVRRTNTRFVSEVERDRQIGMRGGLRGGRRHVKTTRRDFKRVGAGLRDRGPGRRQDHHARNRKRQGETPYDTHVYLPLRFDFFAPF